MAVSAGTKPNEEAMQFQQLCEAMDGYLTWRMERDAGTQSPCTCRPRQKGGRKKRHHNTVEDTWLTCHRQFVKELDEWDKQGGWDVLFYGDSIVEEWRCVLSTRVDWPHICEGVAVHLPLRGVVLGLWNVSTA